MKILITGVRGVIGSKLEEILLAKGHKVFGIDLFHTNKIYGHGLGKLQDENYFRCDISEYRQIEQVMTHIKPDFVYNCAAEFGRWNGEHFYEQVWKTNAIGTKNIIRLQEKFRFKLVHFSSSEVYGDYQDVMYEDLLNRIPITQMNDYAISKRVNEMQIENSRIMNKTETVIVRIFNTYGPGEWYHPFRSVNCTFTYNLLHGKPIKVFAGHTRTSTYIYDAVNAMANICEEFKNGECYNIASSERHSIEHLAELIVKYTGANQNLVEFVQHKEILTTKDKIVDNSKAVEQLKFKSTMSLESGVKNTVDWMKNYYNINKL